MEEDKWLKGMVEDLKSNVVRLMNGEQPPITPVATIAKPVASSKTTGNSSAS